MDLIELTPDYNLSDFDCGDEQLNNFLFEDAKPSIALRVANTFILIDDGRVAAYFCLLWGKFERIFFHRLPITSSLLTLSLSRQK